MAHTGKIRAVRNEMLYLYGRNCWMLYGMDAGNPFTYHHLLEKRKGGDISLENGAILTFWAHQDLNQLDRSNKDLYRDLNLLFKELNKTEAPPTIEYYKEVNGILLKAKEIITLSRFNSLDVDYGLLSEMIEKANAEGNVRGHMELLKEYYEREKALYIIRKAIEKAEPISHRVTKKKRLRKRFSEVEIVYIPEQYRNKIKHKNRNNRGYIYKRNRTIKEVYIEEIE